MSYTDTDQYQQEIAAQYKMRVVKFPKHKVAEAIGKLGFELAEDDLKEARVGNVNATYIAPKIVVKVSRDRDEVNYLANKIVSEKLVTRQPVMKVLAYDYFEKTDFEILVMERVSGTLLLDDIFDVSKEDLTKLFRQVVSVVNAAFTITFADFGWVNNTQQHFKTYSEFISHDFKNHVATIRTDKLCREEEISRVEKYFLGHVHIFDHERPVFIHTDLHMGNILHVGDELTAILDWDYSLRAPKMAVLESLLGFINNPQQFVEGTEDFPKYQGKKFSFLLPILREELSEVFADPLLVQKLNLRFIGSGIMWIADNWSEEWNKEMMANIIAHEIPEDEEGLKESYYGKILK